MSRSDASKPVADRFVNRMPHKSIGGMDTDGSQLSLYGNRIAWWDEDGGLYIQASGFGGGSCQPGFYTSQSEPASYQAGDFTGSPVTLHRLNMLPGVRLSRMRNKTYLNGKVWAGEPVKVNTLRHERFDDGQTRGPFHKAVRNAD